MEVLLKSVVLYDPTAALHGKPVDLLVRDGRVAGLAPAGTLDAGGTLAGAVASANAEVWEVPGSWVSVGWMDGAVDFGEPGFEVREGLASGLRAAAAGGFTDVALVPASAPPPDAAAELELVQRRAVGGAARVWPLACLSAGRRGERLADLLELHASGAIGFSDDGPIARPELLRRGLEYAADTGRPVVALPIEPDLNPGATMHEGVVSTRMGVPATPHEAETMRLMRDLELLRYAGGRLHVSCVSTAAGCDLIRRARAEGLEVTAATTCWHLVGTDADCAGFDGLYKVMPPLRTAADRDALRAAVLDGTLQAVVSDHRPADLEHHDTAFMESPFGIAGTEACFAAALHGLSEQAPRPQALEALVRALTVGVRGVYGLEVPRIEVDAPACLTWFHPDQAWTWSRTTRAANVGPWEQRGWTGEPLGTIRPEGAVRRGLTPRPADR